MRFFQRIAREQSDENTTDPKKLAPSLIVGVVGDEKGATAIEYALIGTGIAVAIIGIVFALGDEISNLFKNIQEIFAAKTPG